MSDRDSRTSSTSRRAALARLGLLPLAGLWSRLAAAEDGVSADEIVIGQNITLQDGKNSYGVAALEGIKLQFDAVNAGERVHGRRLVLRTLDDQNQAATAEANARQLLRGGAFLLFGCIEGGPSTAVAAVAQQAGVPLFGPMAGSPGLRRPHLPMVFPVRAEHREEFRALMQYAKGIGLNTVGLFHADSDVGRQHLANVRAIAQDIGAELVLPMPFKPDIGDAGLAALAGQIVKARPQFVLNHGSNVLYGKLIRAARAAGASAQFFAVNSGSSQLAQDLGPMAQGMVFAQVVPSPWEGKTLLAREYQAAARGAKLSTEFSYGALEGFMTAKALVLALRAAGPKPTRAGFVKAMHGFQADLGGVRLRYAAGDHEGSHFVDLSMVARSGRFIH